MLLLLAMHTVVALYCTHTLLSIELDKYCSLLELLQVRTTRNKLKTMR